MNGDQNSEQPQEPRYLPFPALPKDAVDNDGNRLLNRWSHAITREHAHPAAQVCLPLRPLENRSEYLGHALWRRRAQ